jgi:hypothetical protein
MVALYLPARGPSGGNELSAAGDLVEIFHDHIGIEDNLAIVENEHRQLLHRRDARIFIIRRSRRDRGRHEFDSVDQAELDRRDAHLAGKRRGGREGEFHLDYSFKQIVSLVMAGHSGPKASLPLAYDPAIHALLAAEPLRRGCPGQARA